jgi:CheY-like chemotaxis protein
LLVGSADRSEFRDAQAVLDEFGVLVPARDIDSAVAVLADGQLVPDVIVVAQAYPGQFSPEALDRLRRLVPFARVLALLGSWCEGEMRTGDPWPAAIRIYWHQWLPRAHQELARLREGACSTWALPITASEEERLLLLADEPFQPRDGLIAIFTPQFDMHDWLAAACARRGYDTAWMRPSRPRRVENVRAAIFDGNDCRGKELQWLRDAAAMLSPIPTIALLDFPRVDDCRRALAAGARAVLSKPLLLEDLFWQIDRLTEHQPDRLTPSAPPSQG